MKIEHHWGQIHDALSLSIEEFERRLRAIVEMRVERTDPDAFWRLRESNG